MNVVRILSIVAAVAFLTWALIRASDDHGQPTPQPSRRNLSHPSFGGRAPFTTDELDRARDAWTRATGSGHIYDQEGERL